MKLDFVERQLCGHLGLTFCLRDTRGNPGSEPTVTLLVAGFGPGSFLLLEPCIAREGAEGPGNGEKEEG